MSKNNIKNKLLEDVSERLEKLGIDNFAKEIMCKEGEPLSAFMTA